MAIPIKIALVLAATLLATAAHANDVPTLNVKPTCTPIGNDKVFPIDTKQCLRSEQEARDQLVKEWANFPAADRSLCTQTASMGGMASYVALITCLEMKRDVAKLPAGRGLNTQPSSLPTKKK
ncbi:MAG: hypothetical protein E6G97_00745 [Alphaproteobacteria bacterium]|nr:MAG: hypothetical protein E6G97_00745 [Alphaproteobacteria bacterium]